MTRNNRPTKGNPMHDPVARNIRNQQMQDARPSKEELNLTPPCEECETEADSVERRGIVFPNCSRMQHPEKVSQLLCDDCADARPSLREKAIKQGKARRDADHTEEIVAVAIYDCGRWEYVEPAEQPTIEVEEQVGWDDDGNPIMETREVPEPHANPRPTAPIACECGESLDEIVRLDDD